MADYDAIAADYRKTNYERPLFRLAIYPSFFDAVWNVNGKSVLDLGCGEGIVAREMQRRGASNVVGVDASAKMVALAEETEREEKLGIDYRQGVVGTLGRIGTFDVVTAAFLLHYAKTEEELKRMCKDAYDNLAPGGLFVTVNNNPAHPTCGDGKYGNTIRCAHEQPRDGDELLVHHPVPGTEVRFANYYWSKETYERALRDAGFKDIEWVDIAVTPEGEKEKGETFWRGFLDAPFFAIIRCGR